MQATAQLPDLQRRPLTGTYAAPGGEGRIALGNLVRCLGSGSRGRRHLVHARQLHGVELIGEQQSEGGLR